MPFTAIITSLLSAGYSHDLIGVEKVEAAFENWMLELDSTVGIVEMNRGFAYRVIQPAEDLNIFILGIIKESYIYNQYGQLLASVVLSFMNDITILFSSMNVRNK